MRLPAPPTRVVALTVAIAAVQLAACSSAHDALPTAPAASLADRGGVHGSMSDVSAGLPSTIRYVTPSLVMGNTDKDGSSDCPTGSIATKVDGAYSQKVSGYQFTVSGSDKNSLAFAPIPGTTPTSVITAVLVKGGPAYDVYQYGVGTTSDAGLTPPYNNGGNIAGISHYVVCSTPITTPRITKTLIEVNMQPQTGGMVAVARNSTAWLTYRIDYQLPAGLTATFTENVPGLCTTISPGFSCSSSYFNSTLVFTMGSTTFTATGSGSVYFTVDFKNVSACGDRSFTNTLGVSFDGGTTPAPSVQSGPITLWPACR